MSIPGTIAVNFWYSGIQTAMFGRRSAEYVLRIALEQVIEDELDARRRTAAMDAAALLHALAIASSGGEGTASPDAGAGGGPPSSRSWLAPRSDAPIVRFRSLAAALRWLDRGACQWSTSQSTGIAVSTAGTAARSLNSSGEHTAAARLPVQSCCWRCTHDSDGVGAEADDGALAVQLFIANPSLTYLHTSLGVPTDAHAAARLSLRTGNESLLLSAPVPSFIPPVCSSCPVWLLLAGVSTRKGHSLWLAVCLGDTLWSACPHR